MLHKKLIKLASHLCAAISLIVISATPSFAQSNTQNTIGAIGNLFGSLAQASAKANAQKKWAQVDPQIVSCVNTMFATKNVNVDQIIAAGMSPTDQRIAPVVTLCQTVMTAQLKTDFPCNVTNAKGQQVPTTCVQSFAKAVNGSLTPVSRDDFLRAAANGEKVEVGTFETTTAQNARLAEERRLAEAERQRFLASPEGKRQIAAEAARARAAEVERQRAEAARVAEQARRPRGYYLVCAGDGKSSRYNFHNVNCSSSYEVMNAFRWAIAKLASDVSSNSNYFHAMAGSCRDTMYKYSDLPSQVMTDHGVIYGLWAACNAALSEMAGPSAAQASGRRGR